MKGPRRSVYCWRLILATVFLLQLSEVGLHADEAERLFTLRVLPLLKVKCFGCHGGDPEDVRGALDIRSRVGLLKGGKSEEPALVSGDPEGSPMYQAVLWDGLEMPPKENDRLTKKETESLRDWIAAGAPWPDAQRQLAIQRQEWSVPENEDGIIVPTSGGLADDWTYRRYKPEDIWAFQPVGKAAIERLEEEGQHPIDFFVAAKLGEAGLEPAGRADSRTLIRRATFDLTGLPPTPEEVEAFQGASIQNPKSAFRNLVDRLLASKHYGERWGQHWLDVVRYADTSGYSNDWERSNAWRYRDYVIRSFNDDKPYDQFVLEQLAGDELEPNNPEMLVATGYLRMGPWEHTAMTPDKVSRQLYLDDLVNSVGQTFLSTAMRCCKCHDHKFDPLPTRDYYRLYAALATTQPAERPAAFLSVEDASGFDENRRHVDALLKFAVDERTALYAKREKAARKWYADRNRADEYKPINERRQIKGEDKPPRFVGLTTEEEGVLKIREQDARIWTRRQERFQARVLSVYSGGDLYQKSMRLRMPDPKKKIEMTQAKTLPETSIYSGGSVFAVGDSITPGVLSGLGLASYTPKEDDDYALPETMEGRRLALARWVASPNNALTTRSIVNRVWSYHFGRGIAGNPNNFGATGKKPTHPQLLDWLATEFVDKGWSIKALHRLIMGSQAYQRASQHPAIDVLREKDSNNDLLAVFEPRRLTAEEVRDSMLAVSGELDRHQGGLPIKPEINLEVALAPRMLQFSLAPAWQPSRTPKERNRRAIYAYRVRGLPDPLLEVFNKPNADDSCEMREQASVTPQVFSLMNSDVATSHSLAFAVRLQQEADTTRDRIVRGYRLALGRAPSDTILRQLVSHYEAMVSYHQTHKPMPIKYPTRVTRSVVEEMSGEAFEYEEYLDIYEDYVPDVQAADVTPEVRALGDICLLMFNANAFLYVY